MRVVLAAALLSVFCSTAVAQPTRDRPNTPAEAYFEFLLARRLEAQGNTAGALEALKRAQALDPSSAEINAEIAGFYARQNQGSEAIAAAERALAVDPKNLEGNRILGLVFAAWSEGAGTPPPGRTRAQIRASAIEHLTRIFDSPAVATDLNLQLTLARLQLRAGQADRAIPILENIATQAPFATEPHALLAEARLSVGRVDDAITALRAAAELNPRHYVSLGELYEQQGRWQEAAQAYEQAAGTPGAPRDVPLRLVAALLNIPGGEGAATARDRIRDYLMTSPQDARGLFLLSSAHLQLGDLKGAEDVARKLIALEPTSLSGLHALSSALAARREYRQVVELLAPFSRDAAARAKGRETDGALLLAQLAQAHSELGEHDQAVRVLTTAITTDPLSAPALNLLGYLLADRGERLPEAVGFIERALQIDPDNPAYLDSLGWAYYRQGRADEAEPYLRKAAEGLPTQSVVHDHHGDALEKLGRHAEAIAAWERALAGDGEDIDPALIQKKIKDARARQQ
jgi:tetratricopeptide (TPR) repeat protein